MGKARKGVGTQGEPGQGRARHKARQGTKRQGNAGHDARQAKARWERTSWGSTTQPMGELVDAS
jgi:hypothetical protein